MANVCEMIKPHHPDCLCGLCRAFQDEKCAAVAVGVVADSRVRVCIDCAVSMEREGFAVEYSEKGRQP